MNQAAVMLLAEIQRVIIDRGGARKVRVTPGW
jgi:hypothetical protein